MFEGIRYCKEIMKKKNILRRNSLCVKKMGDIL